MFPVPGLTINSWTYGGVFTVRELMVNMKLRSGARRPLQGEAGIGNAL